MSIAIAVTITSIIIITMSIAIAVTITSITIITMSTAIAAMTMSTIITTMSTVAAVMIMVTTMLMKYLLPGALKPQRNLPLKRLNLRSKNLIPVNTDLYCAQRVLCRTRMVVGSTLIMFPVSVTSEPAALQLSVVFA
jgi:hypothetical protein